MLESAEKFPEKTIPKAILLLSLASMGCEIHAHFLEIIFYLIQFNFMKIPLFSFRHATL